MAYRGRRKARQLAYLLPLGLLAGVGIARSEDEWPEDETETVAAAMPARPGLDYAEAGFLRDKAEHGDPAMQCLYGLALLNGSAGRTDAVEAAHWLRLAAEGGDDRARFEYGKLLYLGIGLDRDQPESLRWLVPAAERGLPEAAYYVGAALLAGDGVEHDAVQGERWLRQAAESGIATAQADLGIAYYSGIGEVQQDYGEARRWFTLAAKQGSGDSANKLGVIYRNGLGVTPDPERAILWFTMGASLGDRYAQYNLACSYMNGEWVGRDYAQAARWHEQSARRGNPESQYLLGCLYAEGLGVPRDAGRAREWLTQADRGGQASAAELLERLYEMDDNEPLPPPPTGPARVAAAALLREFTRSPIPGIDRGRVVILTIEDEVEIAPSEEGGSYFLTVPGCPGAIFLTLRPGANPPRPGSTMRGLGVGGSGLPGFIRLTAVEQDEGDTEAVDPATAEGEQRQETVNAQGKEERGKEGMRLEKGEAGSPGSCR